LFFSKNKQKKIMSFLVGPFAVLTIIFINVLQFVLFGLVGWWSETLQNHSISFAQRLWAVLFPLAVGQPAIVVTGDAIRPEDRAVIISNHQVDIDWWYLWCLARAFDCHGMIRICAKSELKWVPIIGWGMYLFDFLFLSRRWELDQLEMEKKFSKWVKSSIPFFFIIFPEGTTVQTQGMITSAEFAAKANRSVLQRLLLPRVTGLRKALECLTNADCVYDVTLCYDGYTGEIPTYEDGYDRQRDKAIPSFQKVLKGFCPKKVYFHITRRPIPPLDLDNFTRWLDECWLEKDRRLDQFVKKQTLVLDNE